MLQKLRGKLWSASRVHLGCKQLYCTKYEPAAAVHGPAEPATPDVPASPGASLDAKRPSYIGSPIVGYGGLEAGSTEPAAQCPSFVLTPTSTRQCPALLRLETLYAVVKPVDVV